MTLPDSSKARPSMSQLPTSRPNNISLSAYWGCGPSARRVSIIRERVRNLVALAMASKVARGSRGSLSRSCANRGRRLEWTAWGGDRRDVGQASHEYGTTLRAYDPKIDAWRVTFVAPVFGATVNLIAREHGNEIWLEGRAPDNSLCRWTFSEITSERVRWQGFSSSDEGLTWTREEEMILRRRG